MKFVLVLIPLCSVQFVTSTFCYWNTGCPYKYFSSRTPYISVRGDIRDSLVKLTGCEPVSIWGLVRHGQKNPDIEFGNHMKAAVVIKDYIAASYEAGKCSLCAQDVENLKRWRSNQEIFNKPSQLTKDGIQECTGIGRRLQQAFPKLLEKLDKNDYLFRPSVGDWIVNSAKAFVEGLNDRPLAVDPPKFELDILSPFESCGKYITDVRNNPHTYRESKKYLNSPEYLASKDRIQRRLGIDYPLTNENITALYDLCRYTLSGSVSKYSPWCAIFTTDDLKVMEYMADLRHYYRNGYGTPTNELYGQITLTDLLKSFQGAKIGNGRKITTYVSHATMMDMVFTALKLFKDKSPLTGSRSNPNRKWRSSKMAVFSSNLMVVLNKCNHDNNDYNVVFYFNEEPLLSICREGVCTWKEFEAKLSPFLKTNIDFCTINVDKP